MIRIFPNLKTILFSMIALSSSFLSFADDYVVVGKEAKVFDEPNSKGYVTLNQKNEEVNLLPGMVFKSLDKTQGWHIIEYSPGLRGYLSEQVKATDAKLPSPGTYVVKNNPSVKLTVESSAGKWTARSGEKYFTGKAGENAVVFYDAKGVPAYSLVNIGNTSVAMTYDNDITKFF